MPKRVAPRSVRLDSNIRALRVYPVEETNRRLSELQTVGIKLSREQAIHLARVLLLVTQEWDEIEVTAYRLECRRTDGTYHVTVTASMP
jgi:hypothetical protein